MILAKGEPVTVKAVLNALASRFSKLVTLTASPVVWSVPAPTAKFTAVVPPETDRISVSVPVPPSIDVSEPR